MIYKTDQFENGSGMACYYGNNKQKKEVITFAKENGIGWRVIGESAFDAMRRECENIGNAFWPISLIKKENKKEA